jgi:hypothetical protein
MQDAGRRPWLRVRRISDVLRPLRHTLVATGHEVFVVRPETA